MGQRRQPVSCSGRSQVPTSNEPGPDLWDSTAPTPSRALGMSMPMSRTAGAAATVGKTAASPSRWLRRLDPCPPAGTPPTRVDLFTTRQSSTPDPSARRPNPRRYRGALPAQLAPPTSAIASAASRFARPSSRRPAWNRWRARQASHRRRRVAHRHRREARTSRPGSSGTRMPGCLNRRAARRSH
jgi:hypothetical protein